MLFGKKILQAEQYDRVMRDVNNKNVQTEGPIIDTREAQCEQAKLEVSFWVSLFKSNILEYGLFSKDRVDQRNWQCSNTMDQV